MGLQFMLLPFLLLFLSSEELGVWYVMVSFSNIANLFSFGFTPAFARNVAYCWNGAKQLKKMGKERDVEQQEGVDFFLLKKILVTSRYLYLVFALTGTLCIALFGTIHIWKIASSILGRSIQIGWLVFLVAIFLNIYYGYYSSYLVGIGKVKESNQIIVVAAIGRITVTAILMFMHLGILGAALGYLVHGILLRFLSKKRFYSSQNLENELTKIRSVRISLKEMKECFQIVWYNAWRDGVVSVSEYLSTQMSTIVCSNFLSLADTAVFSLTTQLVTAVGKIARSIHNAHTPVFQRAYITGDEKTARETQAFCIFIYAIVFILGILALITVGIPILGVFKPDAKVDRLIIAGYAVYQFMLSYRNCYGAYLSCTNRVWYWKSYIITSFVVVLTYTILLYNFGSNVWYIIVISVLGESIYNFRKWPGLVNKELNMKAKDIVNLGVARIGSFFL